MRMNYYELVYKASKHWHSVVHRRNWKIDFVTLVSKFNALCIFSNSQTYFVKNTNTCKTEPAFNSVIHHR